MVCTVPAGMRRVRLRKNPLLQANVRWSPAIPVQASVSQVFYNACSKNIYYAAVRSTVALTVVWRKSLIGSLMSGCIPSLLPSFRGRPPPRKPRNPNSPSVLLKALSSPVKARLGCARGYRVSSWIALQGRIGPLNGIEGVCVPGPSFCGVSARLPQPAHTTQTPHNPYSPPLDCLR